MTFRHIKKPKMKGETVMNNSIKDVNGKYTPTAFFSHKCKDRIVEVTRNLTDSEMLIVFQTCRDIRMNSIVNNCKPDLCNSEAIKFTKQFTKASKKRSCAHKRLLKKIGIISLIAVGLSVILLIVSLFVPQFYISSKMWLWSIVAYAFLTFVISATDLVNYFMLGYEINDILENVNLSAFKKMFPKINIPIN